MEIKEVFAGIVTVQQFASFHKITLSEVRRRKKAYLMEQDYDKLVCQLEKLDHDVAEELFDNLVRCQKHFQKHHPHHYQVKALREIFGFTFPWEGNEDEDW